MNLATAHKALQKLKCASYYSYIFINIIIIALYTLPNAVWAYKIKRKHVQYVHVSKLTIFNVKNIKYLFTLLLIICYKQARCAHMKFILTVFTELWLFCTDYIGECTLFFTHKTSYHNHRERHCSEFFWALKISKHVKKIEIFFCFYILL
jgi:hypothetical protein